jgi:hypothetical protein
MYVVERNAAAIQSVSQSVSQFIVIFIDLISGFRLRHPVIQCAGDLFAMQNVLYSIQLKIYKLWSGHIDISNNAIR